MTENQGMAENQGMGIDRSLQFELKSETNSNGQITFKVIPINQTESIISSICRNSNSSSDAINNQQNLWSSSNSLDTEARITMLPNIDTSSLYLMMSAQDTSQQDNNQQNSLINHRLKAKSTPSSPNQKLFHSPTNRTIRDERRRANHNEVERRRRDTINKWIVELSKVIPDCSNDHTKHGQSKGGILEKTVQYLIDMRLANQELKEQFKKLEKLKAENEILKLQNENYRKENQMQRMQLENMSVGHHMPSQSIILQKNGNTI